MDYSLGVGCSFSTEPLYDFTEQPPLKKEKNEGVHLEIVGKITRQFQLQNQKAYQKTYEKAYEKIYENLYEIDEKQTEELKQKKIKCIRFLCTKIEQKDFKNFLSNDCFFSESLEKLDVDHIELDEAFDPLNFYELLFSKLNQAKNLNFLKIEGSSEEDFKFKLTNPSVCFLSNFLNKFKKLENLDLSFNLIEDIGAISLANSIRHCPALTRLSLRFNYIREKGAIALSSGCENLEYLECLDLSENFLGDKAVEALARTCKKITALFLDEIEITEKGVVTLSNWVNELKDLKKLSLKKNDIDSDGFKKLSSALMNCKKLTGVNLSDNRIGDEGVEELAKAIGTSPNCKILNLSCNSISQTKAALFMKNYLNIDCSFQKNPNIDHNRNLFERNDLLTEIFFITTLINYKGK